jgi:hypothetical protein
MNPAINDWVHLMETVSDRPFALAITITFCRWRNSAQQALNHDIAVSTIKELFKRLNREIFNHSAKRRGNTIGSVVVVGRNRPDGHLHAHLALTAPPNMGFAEFVGLIQKIITRLHWINKQCHIQPYRNRLWLRYMAKHGTDSLVLECCNKARP